MGLLPQFRSVNKALRYSDQFDYPLTADEIWYWQAGTSYSFQKIKKLLLAQPRIKHLDDLFFLAGRSHIVKIRHLRHSYSQIKFDHAQKITQRLRLIPTIQAVFLTGALCMHNSPKNDDIDLMIIASPHTLWLTRFLVVILLGFQSLRRPPSLPEHSSPRVNNKICDNLYLSSRHLRLSTHSFYLAHEVLQARPLWQKTNIHIRFLRQNSWTKTFLPVASVQALKQASARFPHKPDTSYWYLFPLNLVLFVAQYLYMKRRLTTERIGLDYAFFHPRPPQIMESDQF